MHAHCSEITQFRPRRLGPELRIQETVEKRIHKIFGTTAQDVWAASGLPLGAGMPDLLVASYHRDVLALAHVDMSHSEILAYLRVVRSARLETIASRLQMTKRAALKRIEALINVQVLSVSDKAFVLPPRWKEILPEIVAVEVKVSDWHRAIEQAARNRIFANRSFVALPEQVALRVRAEPLFRQLGLGLISVIEGGAVHVLRKARRRQPMVWNYYYKLAVLLARSFSS